MCIVVTLSGLLAYHFCSTLGLDNLQSTVLRPFVCNKECHGSDNSGVGDELFRVSTAVVAMRQSGIPREREFFGVSSAVLVTKDLVGKITFY